MDYVVSSKYGETPEFNIMTDRTIIGVREFLNWSNTAWCYVQTVNYCLRVIL